MMMKNNMTMESDEQSGVMEGMLGGGYCAEATSQFFGGEIIRILDY